MLELAENQMNNCAVFIYCLCMFYGFICARKKIKHSIRRLRTFHFLFADNLRIAITKFLGSMPFEADDTFTSFFHISMLVGSALRRSKPYHISISVKIYFNVTCTTCLCSSYAAGNVLQAALCRVSMQFGKTYTPSRVKVW